MGVIKRKEFNKGQNQLAVYTKALGHPARIAILQYLKKAGASLCGEVVEVIPLAQSTVSQHLFELKKAGLIKGVLEGSSIFYRIHEKNWKRAHRTIHFLFK